ncbi:Fatty acid hydroxylase family (carotene hydroxylase/sterol desaturase) [hydrothermal vent metagenome]|uniref:Fatty acid hydroxylase family (Carotene hydroxylase/sterol desaturase) n=1 Tax=hydrothermal vent metagenome TaxID=652676 RepID=A0A3B0RUA5_9ZZZZ
METKLIVLAIFVIFAVLEAFRTGFLYKQNQQKHDGWIDFLCGVVLIGMIQPLVLLTSMAGLHWLWPQGFGMFAQTPIILQILAFIIFDDLSQYWWHRSSHKFAFLYNLHRPHHNAQYLSVRIVYRNNFFYYMMMPGLWLSGLLVYVGFGWVYAGYLLVKLAVIIAAHSDVAWDAPLYRIKWLQPLMWVVERTISTPSTHAMHHGRHKSDGITHYKGNYGNLLFFWDVIFGTARITRQRPQQFGVENLPDIGIGQQLLWPLIRPVKQATKEVQPTGK